MHKSSFKKNITTIKASFKEIYKLQPYIIPVYIMESFFKAIAPFINIYMSSRIIDELMGQKDTNILIKLVLITIGLNFALYLLSSGLNHVTRVQMIVLMKNQQMKLNETITNMDYENIENPEVHGLRNKIAESNNINKGIHALIWYSGEFVKGIVSIVTSIALVINLFWENTNFHGDSVNSQVYSYIFLFMIIIGTILILKLQTKGDKKVFKYYNKFIDSTRVGLYYIRLLNDYNTGKAIRLCNQKKIINREMKMFNEGFNKMYKDMSKINAKYEGVQVFISSLLSGVVYLFVALKAVAGTISVGCIVKYVGSINQFMEGSKMILSSINDIINNNQYAKLYIDFLNIESKNHKGTLPVEKRDDDEYEIEFKNVSFKYPGTENYVLKNVSMKLNIGERLAIVGMNGSGKTTFIKLLCRLYEPNEGEILLNGINIKKYDYEEYMRLFSIVFQDFKLFSFSLGQNVSTAVNYDEEGVNKALEKVGFEDRLETMPNGLSTSLYKEFDENGVEISGGEAQKIALARAIHRDAPIIILDEPTAALDPISEFEIYSKFNEIVSTKTAFYISHRLSSCRFCDEIAVFNNGEIIQKGSHEELLNDQEGKYYELWHSQAQYYVSEESA